MIRNIFIICSLFMSLTALGQSACGDPTQFIENFTHRIQDIIKNKDFKESQKLAQIGQEMDKLVDVQMFAKKAVGRKYWVNSEPQELKKLSSCIKNDLLNDYATALLDKSDYVPAVLPFRWKDSDYQTVGMSYTRQGMPSFKANYALVCKQGQWLIYDVQVNGILLSSLQKSQYAHFLKNGGAASLIKHLELVSQSGKSQMECGASTPKA